MIANLLIFSTFGAIVSAATTTSSSSSTTTSSTSSTSSASSSSSASTNPFIPSSISSACQAALNTINSDSALQTCTSNIASVVSAFSPSSGTVSSGDVSGAITQLCTSGQVSGCTADKIRSLLTTFENGCSTELSASSPTADQELVKYQYDLLYATPSFTGAVCAMDTTSKKPCLLEIVSGTTASPAGGSTDATDGTANTTVSNSTSKATSSGSFDFKQFVDQSALKASNLFLTLTSDNEQQVMSQIFSGSSSSKKRAASDDSNSVAIPNTALFAKASLPFLFLTTDMPASIVCTQCTQTILMVYMQFQESHTYFNGIQNSVILSGETEFYQGLSGLCGAGFVSSISQTTGTNGAGRVGLGLGALVGLVGLAALI